MRTATFVLAGLQIVLLILFAIGSSASDAAGNAMSAGFVTLGGILMAVFLVPALILAINSRAEGVAFGLTLVSMLICIFVLNV